MVNNQEDQTDNYNKIDSHSGNNKSTESLCTPCRIEIAERQGRENAAGTADIAEEHEDDVLTSLMQASKSFSEISVRDELDFDIDQETLFYIESNHNLDGNENVMNDKSSPDLVPAAEAGDSSLTTTNIRSLNSEMENGPLHCLSEKDRLLNEESDFLLKISSLRDETIGQSGTKPKIKAKSSILEEPPMKRTKTMSIVSCDKATQTESSSTTEESGKLINGNYGDIAMSVIERKRHIHDLVNDIYATSCCLDEMRKVLASGASSSANPTPLKLNGYDDQFDFPHRSRFSKLPITIESVVSEKSRENSTSSNGKRQNKFMKASEKSSLVKSINNKVEIALPKRFKQQQTIKEMFLGNKENVKNNQNNGKSKKTPNKSDIGSAKDDSSDSGSLYNYNPLRYARENRK